MEKILLVRGVFRLRAMSPYYPMWDILGRVATGRLDISTLSCPSPVSGPSCSSLVLFEDIPPPLLLEGKQGTAFSHGPPAGIPIDQQPRIRRHHGSNP